MVRYLCLYSLFVVLLASCNNLNRKYLSPNIEVESEDLKYAILEYDSMISRNSAFVKGTSGHDYLLTVYERNVNDSVKKYEISYSLDTWLMQESPIWLANVCGKYVVFYPSNNYKGILATDQQLHREIAKKFFPEEYKLLIKGKPLNCFVFNDGPSLMLTFVKGKLVTKKFYKGV